MAELGACVCTKGKHGESAEALKPQCTQCTHGDDTHRLSCINICFNFIQNSMYLNCPRTMAHIKDVEVRLGFHVKRLKGEGKVAATCRKKSLLILACKFTHLDAVKYLLAEFSILNLDPKPTDVDDSRNSAFFYAFEHNHLTIVQLLFNRWAQWPFDYLPDIIKRCKSIRMEEIMEQTYKELAISTEKLSAELKTYLTNELTKRAILYRTTHVMNIPSLTNECCVSAGDGILKAIEVQLMLFNNDECWNNLRKKYITLSDEDKVKLLMQCFQSLSNLVIKGELDVLTYFTLLEEHLMKEGNNAAIWKAVSEEIKRYGFLILGSKYDREELISYLVSESKLLEFCRIMGHPCQPTDEDAENMRAIDYAILHNKSQIVRTLFAYWPEWPFHGNEHEVANAQQSINIGNLMDRGFSIIYKNVPKLQNTETEKFITEELKFRAFNHMMKMAVAASEKSAYMSSEQIPERKELILRSIKMSLDAFIQYLDNIKENNCFNEAKHWILQFVAENMHNVRKLDPNQGAKNDFDELEFTVTSMLLPLMRYQELQVVHNHSRQFILDSANDYIRNKRYIITEESVMAYQHSTQKMIETLAKVEYLSETRNSTITMLKGLIDKLPLSSQNEKNSIQETINPETYKFKYYGPLRDLIYFSNIDQYIQLALSVDLKKDMKFGILAIDRVLQVTGECFKSTQESSHISPQGQNFLFTHGIPVQVFTSIRDAMSHQKAIGTLSIIESKLSGVEMKDSKYAEEADDSGVYLHVQKDLQIIRSRLLKAIADVETTLTSNISMFPNGNKDKGEINNRKPEDRIKENLEKYPVLRDVVKSFHLKNALENSTQPTAINHDSLLKSPNYNNESKQLRPPDQLQGINRLHIGAKSLRSKIDVSLREARSLYHNFLVQLKNGTISTDKNKTKLVSILEKQKTLFEAKEKLLKMKDETEYSKNGGSKLLNGLNKNRSPQKNLSGNGQNYDKTKKSNTDSNFNQKELHNLCKENLSEAKNKIGKIKTSYETFMKILQQAAKGEIINERIMRACQDLDLDDDETKLFNDALSKFSKLRNDDNIKQRTLEIFVEGICQIVTKNNTKFCEQSSVTQQENEAIKIDSTFEAYQQHTSNIRNKKDFIVGSLKKAIDIHKLNKKWLWFLGDYINLEDEELKAIIDMLISEKSDKEKFIQALIKEEQVYDGSSKNTKNFQFQKNACKIKYLKSNDYKNNNFIDIFIAQILKGAPNEKVKKAFSDFCTTLGISDNQPQLWKACRSLLETLYDYYFENQVNLLKERLRSEDVNVADLDDLLDRMNGDLTLRVSIEILIYNIINTIKNITTNEKFSILERIIIKFVMSAQKNNSTLPTSFKLRNELAHWNILTNMTDSNLGKLVVGTVHLFVNYSESINDLAKLMEYENCWINIKHLLLKEECVFHDVNEAKLLQKLKNSSLFENLKMKTILKNAIDAALAEQNSSSNAQSPELCMEQPRISCDFIPKAYWNSVRENNEQKLFYCQDRRGASKAPGTNSWTLLHQATEFGNQRITEKLLNQKVSSGTNLLMPLHVAAIHGHHELVTYFLKNNMYKDGESYCTPLTLATINNRKKTVKILLGHVTSRDDNDRENQLSTSLLLASKYGHDQVVVMLLEHKANIESKTEKGWTPLHLAASRSTGLSTIHILFSNIGSKWTKPNIMSRTASGKTPLHLAARYGHLEIVQYLCKLKADDASVTNKGRTPLHYAADYGRYDVIKYLLTDKERSKVQLKDEQDEMPIHCAAKHGHTNICQLLIEKGANPKCENSHKYLPIHVAAENGHVETVRLLAKSKEDIKCKTEREETPLQLAVKNAHFLTVQLLIELGDTLGDGNTNIEQALDIAVANGDSELAAILIEKIEENRKQNITEDAKNVVEDHSDGRKPIHVATEQGNIDIVGRLITANGKPIINSEMNDGRQAIHLASELGYFSVAELLLANGAEVDHKAKDGRSPIHFAVASNHVDIIKLLIKRKADLDSQNDEGVVPLSLAYLKGSSNTVKLLVENNANIGCILHRVIQNDDIETLKLLLRSETANLEPKDEMGLTPLFFAYNTCKEKIMKMLVQTKRANVNCQNRAGQTILHVAVIRDDMETLIYMLDNGAELNRPSNDGCTALHIAAKSGRFVIAELLVARGADVQSKNSVGFQPIHFACDSGHTDIVNMLLDNGASTECEADVGSKPLHLASGKGHIDVVKLLVEKGAMLNPKNKFFWTPLSLAEQNNQTAVKKYLQSKKATVKETGDKDIA